MACESCRSQAARSIARAAFRAAGAASRAPSSYASTTTTKTTPLFSSRAAATTPSTVRGISTTSRRGFLGFGGGLADSYRVVGSTERLFKMCALPADYYITPEERKSGEVKRLEDGEEVGHSADRADNVWHGYFKFKPTFSTWSHVTMLHLYLLNTRIRCFPRDDYRQWQQQLIDHFFFECEKKMHVEHAITSSALRQRYLKDVFVQWRGLLLAYDEGLIKGDAILASALWRNLFKGDPDADPRALAAVVGWMRKTMRELEAVTDADFSSEAESILHFNVADFKPERERPAMIKPAGAARAKPIQGAPAPASSPRA